MLNILIYSLLSEKIDSLSIFPVNKVCMLYQDQNLKNIIEKRINSFLFEVEYKKCDFNSIDSCYNNIMKIYNSNKDVNKIAIHIPNQYQLYIIAAYIFASQNPSLTELYTIINNKSIAIPVIKSIDYNEYHIRIMILIKKFVKINSLKFLMDQMNLKDDMSERIKLRRALDYLELQGLIETFNKGKNLIILSKDLSKFGSLLDK